MSIQTIGVVGAGQMGNGIAHVASLAGYQVVMTDIAQPALDKGLAVIQKNMARMVSKEKISEEQAAEALGRIETATDLAAHASAQLVVEAATENEGLKFGIFEQLSQVTPAGRPGVAGQSGRHMLSNLLLFLCLSYSHQGVYRSK